MPKRKLWGPIDRPVLSSMAVGLAKAGAAPSLADALLQAADVLRHCVVDGPGCDDAGARRLAIIGAEAALRAAGVAVPGEGAPPASGYGVKVRKTEVRCDDGLSTIDEWQVWSTTPPKPPRGGLCPKTGRALKPARRAWGIHRRFDRQGRAEDFAADLRAQRKASGEWPGEAGCG